MGKNLKTAFLLTAGIGSRLAPHTDKKPKPSLPFLGLPLMNYGFFLTQKANFKDYLFNLHHLPELLKVDVKSIESKMNSCHFLDETRELLGSGGAIWNARHKLKEQDYFLIANGDEILIPKQTDILDKLVSYFLESGALCTLLTCDHPELLKSLKPVWVDDGSGLLGFGSEPITKNAKPEHYTGYKIFSKRIFDLLPEGNSHIFYDVFVEALKNGEKINTFKIENCDWFETGNFKSFVSASKACLTLHLDYFNSVHSFYGNSMELIKNGDHLLYKPKNLELPQSFKWQGVVCLGTEVKIGENVMLHNSFVGTQESIADNSQFTDQFILSN